MAYSTQVFASIVLARTALEAAGYACLISTDQNAEKIWIERNQSSESLKAARNYFTSRRIHDSLASYTTELATTYSRLYETAIEFGAHPNISGLAIGSCLAPIENGVGSSPAPQ